MRAPLNHVTKPVMLTDDQDDISSLFVDLLLMPAMLYPAVAGLASL